MGNILFTTQKTHKSSQLYICGNYLLMYVTTYIHGRRENKVSAYTFMPYLS